MSLALHPSPGTLPGHCQKLSDGDHQPDLCHPISSSLQPGSPSAWSCVYPEQGLPCTSQERVPLCLCRAQAQSRSWSCLQAPTAVLSSWDNVWTKKNGFVPCCFH